MRKGSEKQAGYLLYIREIPDSEALCHYCSYTDWTETHTILVAENIETNTWIVSGQLKNRDSKFEMGAVVFSKSTGEVFYIGRGLPVG